MWSARSYLGSRPRAGVLRRFAVCIILLVSFASVLWSAGCIRRAEAQAVSGSQNLLAGKSPSRVEGGVRRADVMTDGIVARNGDAWDSDLTCVFRRESTFIEYDLGSVVPIRAGFLHADNNDVYVISASEDGSNFKVIWNAPARGGAGLQDRSSTELSGSGRFIRISGSKGDRVYSVSELQLFSEVPSPFPPRLNTRVGLEMGERVRAQVLLFAMGLVLLLLSSFAGAPTWLRVGAAGFAAWTGVSLWQAFEMGWPIDQREVSMVRAACAAVAGVVVLAESLLAARYRPNRRFALGILSLCAAASVATFFNLGHPQFYDHRENHPSFVHNFDMRVYYPVAKYFEELRFDGLYVGSVAAYAEDANLTLSSLGTVELRDLNTHVAKRVSDVEPEIRQIKQRFSSERWAAFKEDMRYFRETMGVDDYLGSMLDHGGNATPVWIAIAKLFFANTKATNPTLLAGAMLDPILLGLMFLVIARTFGLRTMLLSAVIFGANDFYMFGSNWAGATLRHDWLAYLGIGVCMLRRKRWMLGGALLGLSTMIRAFPGLALFGAAIPLGFWLWEFRAKNGRLPTWKELGGHEHPVIRVAIGAAGCALVVFLFSSFLLSFDAWSQWAHKVAILDRDPHVNDVSLRALIAGSDANQHRVLSARFPLFLAALAACFGAIFVTARKRSIEHAAILGAMLTPVVFNPANYYIHYICLLPLLAVEQKEPRAGESSSSGFAPVGRDDALAWAVLAGMCVAQYWTVLTNDKDLHFQSSTAIFFFCTAIFLIRTVRAARSRPEEVIRPQLAPTDVPKAVPAPAAAKAG